MFLSGSPVGINLQKKPEFGERLNILVWKLCLLQELSPYCHTSGHILRRVFSFPWTIFNNNMPFSQCHYLYLFNSFWNAWTHSLGYQYLALVLYCLKACKIENLELGGWRVLWLKDMLWFCSMREFVYSSKEGRAELAEVLLMRKK